jgi:hypothetical protein
MTFEPPTQSGHTETANGRTNVFGNAASNRYERVIIGHSEMIVPIDDRARATVSCPDRLGVKLSPDEFHGGWANRVRAGSSRPLTRTPHD